GGFLGHLEICAADVAGLNWNVDFANDLVLFQGCRHHVHEELRGWDLALAFRSECDDRGFEGENTRWIVRRRVRMRDASTDGALVAYLNITNKACGVGKGGQTTLN